MHLQESVSPTLCKFWWLYGGVNGDLFQEGLCHMQVCRTQSPCPRGIPLLARTSKGAPPPQFCSVSVGSRCTQGLLEPSKHLWWVWGLILNTIPPLLPSCWGFSFALRNGVSFFGVIQHFPVNSYSAASCNFGVLAGEDECIPYIIQLNGNNCKFLLFFTVSKGSYKIHIFIWKTSSCID